MDKIASGCTASNYRFGPADYIKIAVFGFAISALWNSLHSIILPLRLLDFVAESEKNTYLGILSGAGLLLAIIVQPIAGAISDRSGYNRWGRRRPYILIGTIFALLFLPGIALAGGYIALLIIYCLLQISSNTAQGPYQGFIPDLVPEGRRGVASGVKNLLDILGGIALLRLVGPLMDHYLTGEGSSWLWLSLGAVAIVLLAATVATMLMVRERPVSDNAEPSWLSALYGSFRDYFRPNFIRPLVSRLFFFIREHPAFVWFLVSRLLVLMAFVILQRFAIYFLRDVVGVTSPARVAADLLLVVGICMLVSVYPAGRLSDRIGRKPVGISSGLLGAAGMALLFFSDGYSFILASGGFLGVAGGAFMSSNWALATDLVARGEEAKYLGLTNIATAGASALVLCIIGPAIDFLNTYVDNLGYSAMLLVCFVFLIAGSLLLLKIKTQPR